MNGFTLEALPAASLLRRLSGRQRRETAIVNLRNLLASTPLPMIEASAVREICTAGGLIWDSETGALSDIYGVVLADAAADGVLSPAEKVGLARLREGIQMPEAAAGALHERAAHDVYRAKVAEALADGERSDADELTLEMVAQSLELPATQAEQILADEIRKLLSFALQASISDRRWSEADEEMFNSLAKRLGAKVQHDEATQRGLARLRALWRISEGDLPVRPVDLHLAPGEVCHAWEAGGRHEVRAVVQRYDYAGPVVRVPIMKGVKWRMGSVVVNRVRKDQLVELDHGVLYLTNRRLLFDGQKHTSSIVMGRIVRFTLHSDGLKIEKSSGADQWFVSPKGDWETVATCLEALLVNR